MKPFASFQRKALVPFYKYVLCKKQKMLQEIARTYNILHSSVEKMQKNKWIYILDLLSKAFN